MKTLSEEFIASLKFKAKKKTPCERRGDDFNPMEWSGGNFDDCYSLGIDTGEIFQAREVLDALGVSYEV